MRSVLLPALSGVLLLLACPPLNLYPLGWAGLTPLLFALDKPRRSGFIEGFIAGAAFNGGVLHWLAFNNGTSFFIALATLAAAAGILSAAWGAASVLYCRLRCRIGDKALLTVPLSWVAWEGWLAHLGELSFPWTLLALTQSRFGALLQLMEFTGVYGVSFWTASMNVVIFFIARKRRHRLRRYAFLTLMISILIPPAAQLAANRYYRKSTPTVRVMFAQGNIGAREKWLQGADPSWAVYDSLLYEAAGYDIRLAILPETAVPASLLGQSIYADRIARTSDSLNVAILTGASDYYRTSDDETHPLNAAFLFRPDESIIERYAKRHLVPFGERVPFQWLIPALGSLNFGQAEFLPGLRQTVFSANGAESEAHFPALICYESAFPNLTRDAVQQGANLLVTISNDAWYGRSGQPWQIAALSKFRCIETRRAMARASNSGISFLADPLGREIVTARLFETAWAAADLPLFDGLSFYAKHGDLFLAVITTLYGMVLIAVAATSGKRPGSSY